MGGVGLEGAHGGGGEGMNVGEGEGEGVDVDVGGCRVPGRTYPQAQAEF